MKNLKFLPSLLILILIASLASFSILAANNNKIAQENTTIKSAKECQAPSWAIAIGHEQKWKLHNGCLEVQKSQQEKKHSLK